jgi:hypothetical protein
MSQGKDAQGKPVFMRLAVIPVLVKLLVIFLLVYPAFLILSLTFFDANTPLDQRILSPVFVIALILVSYALIEAFKWQGKHRFFKWMALILICIFCAAYLARGARLLTQSFQEGIGFNSAAWQQSPVLKSLQQLPSGRYIYSNAPEGIILQTRRPALGLPKKYNLIVQRPNPRYPGQMEAMVNKIEEEGGIIVYFKGLDWPNLPDERELVQLLPVRILAQYEDGTIYGAAAK